jgi:N-methylhydantoinase A
LTDAYLLCGYIDPKMFLGGRMPLSLELAEDAMDPIGRAIGADVRTAAEACVGVATSNMVAKVLPYLARMGVDPREVTLLAYGGAGPIHASLLADEIGIERVLVPATPSVFCAFGGIVAPFMHDINRTVHGVELTKVTLARVFKDLSRKAKRWLDDQIDASQLTGREIQLFVEARYVGQSFNVSLLVPDEVAVAGDVAAIFKLFHEEHRRLYAHADVNAKVEIIEARARIIGTMTSPEGDLEVERGETLNEISGGRRALFAGSWRDMRVVTLQDFAKGRAEGPTVVECGDTSILVPPRYQATSKDGSFIELRRSA